ncbi:MAG: Ig-like domain-containing protein, partial [Muribaculaceae bacterium]|nr:Ig-like domain-containing protein [Muribaculaceae bacterium]
GETFTAPTLTVDPAAAKPSVVYSSSVSSVAEIANDGTVTIKAVGQTTITAAIPDEDATYKPKSASYTLTVIDPNEVYYLVKTKDDFDVTQECILVAYNNKDSYQAAMGKQIKTNKNAYYREAVPYSPIATSLPDQLNAPDGTVPFILEPNDNATAYYIKVGEGKYISVNTGKSTDTKEVAKSDEITVNLIINETDHKASLKASGGRALGYNNSTNPKRFASYTATDATYNKVYLYQKRSATPALGDIKFSPASGSTVDEGTEITISAQNATSLAYSIKTGDVWSESVMITGNSVNVPVSEDCTISVIAKNDETHEQKSAEATYTVAHPVTYELVEEYNGNDIPDGDYIFASSKDDGSSFAIMGNKIDEYREAILVTPTGNKFDAYSRYAIKVQKEGNGNYSLITSEGKYLYSNTSQDLNEGDNTKAGKWKPKVTGSTVLFTYIDADANANVDAVIKYNISTTPTRFKAYKASTTNGMRPISLYTVQSTKCGTVIFNPAPGSEVPINSTVKISCKNATKISYSITKNEGTSTPVVVPGSVAEVTITEDCIIEAWGTNDEGNSDIADADYYVQTPFTLYTDFYEETDAPYIPDGNYVLVGSVSTGESAGEYYMAEQKDDYRVANKIQPLEDGRLPIDNKYQINIKKEDSGNYSLTTADGKYIYAVSSTTTSGEGESQTTTTTYSVKEGEAAAGQGKWKANIEKGKVYFSWADPSYGDFKFNPQSPRFKTYDPANTNLVSFSLYSTNIPLCRDLKFDHEDGSTVVRGSTVTISCINAAKIFYEVGSGKYVTVEGNKASVIISDDCTITAYAENAAGVPTGDMISATYTVTDPYVEFTGYGSDGSIPDGKYLFVGKTDTNGDLRYMAEQATAPASDGSIYRNAVKVTPFDDGRIGVSDNYAITVKKEEGANYSLITAHGMYLYANSSTSTTGVGESQVTTTNYSVVEGDKTAGEGKWKASVDINNGTVEFVWNDDASTLRYYASGEKSRFKPYKNEAPITGTKFYLYAPTPKPAQVVCTDFELTGTEIKISVNKTITFHSEGAGKMACEILEEDEEHNSVETFDIVDGATYVFTTSPKATYQVVNIIPYDQYGAAHTPSSL